MFRRIGLSLVLATTSTIATATSDGQNPKAGTLTEVDDRLVNLVKTIGSAERLKTDPDSLNFGALSYLSSVYEDTDYYTTGDCDKESNRPIDTSVYIHGLPRHLLCGFRRPVCGEITSAFGLREEGHRMHKGVDIALSDGDSVCAAFDGKVSRIGYDKNGYGYFIVLEHANCVESRYAHLQRPLVKPGEEISAGQQIALGGTSGNSTGPHLHFEIRCNRMPVDPTPLISRR